MRILIDVLCGQSAVGRDVCFDADYWFIPLPAPWYRTQPPELFRGVTLRIHAEVFAPAKVSRSLSPVKQRILAVQMKMCKSLFSATLNPFIR